MPLKPSSDLPLKPTLATQGSSLRGISRINKRACNTTVSIVHAAAYRAQVLDPESA
ncbi:MAG: hypothetical protein ACFB2W_17845 [Leptolyngbyaceae cyanobacterium]